MDTITKDPRPDLLKDHRLWADVLALCNRCGKEELKIMMGALRRAECLLWLENEKLCFSFNRNNLNEDLIRKAKETLKPYKMILKDIFERVANKHASLMPEDWEEEIPF